MNKKNIEQIPSKTALFTTLRRTLANKEYHNEKFGADYLAEIFLPVHYRFFLRFDKVRKNTKQKLAGFMPGLTEYIIARTAFFDELFMNAITSNIPQIVLLGAGYDSRAYRFAQSNRGTKIFELDALPTQTRKRKCLKAARIRIPNEIQYVPINFTNESLSTALENTGYKPQERTLFLWEGVSYYLDWDSVKETLDYVSHASPRESVIGYDYTVAISEENMNTYYGAKEFMKSMKEHHANEEFVFSLKPEEIESFLVERNLKMIDYLDNEAIERKYLTDDNGSLIGRMTGNFRFVCASPMK